MSKTITERSKGEGSILSDRVAGLKDSLMTTSSRLSHERFRFVVEVYRETEGQPWPIRRAKVLDKVLRGMTLYIDENPIVGSLTQYRKGCNPFPEYSVADLRKGDFFSSSGAFDKSRETSEERQVIKEAIDFFSSRSTVEDEILRVFHERHSGVSNEQLTDCGIFKHTTSLPMAGTAVNYAKAINIGLEGVVAEAKEQQAKLFPGYLEDLQRYNYLQAIITSCEAVIAWAYRYADLAEQMAADEADTARKRELEKIAQTCRRVPAKPARTFYEAIQSLWFVHAALLIEAMGLGYSPGRFCQYMYPFYKKDKEKGELNEEQAIELLQLLFIKFSEVQRSVPKRLFRGSEQHMGQNLNIGGLTREGEDATNELDYLVVEAMTRLKVPQPSITLMWHRKLPTEFLLKIIGLAKAGTGFPAFINCNVAIDRLMDSFKVPIEDARVFTVIACVDTVLTHIQDNVWEGLLNVPKMLELALNNGKDPLTGLQLGPQTGDTEKFRSYKDLETAVEKQLDYFLLLLREAALIRQNYVLEMCPTPFFSSLIDDCIPRGKDLMGGGARVSLAIGSSPVGMVDMANSLTAVRKLVFEDKRITMNDLLRALHADFEGYEEIRRLLIGAPKYGNDDDYADRMVGKWYGIFFNVHQKYNTHLGEPNDRPYALSVSNHFHFGELLGALPSGRKAGIPLTDASISATPGTDRNGPTALLNSCLKAIDPVKYSTSLLNVRFHPSVVATREGTMKLLSLIESHFTSGGYHIQFNLVSADTLRDAQAHPENYRSLMVRVAGYSAFFVQLDPSLQEEIMRRTEHGLA